MEKAGILENPNWVTQLLPDFEPGQKKKPPARMDLLQPHSGQEATTIDISKEAAACASWPTRERLRALKRIIPRADIEGALQRTGKDRAHCPRLPAWFVVWFV